MNEQKPKVYSGDQALFSQWDSLGKLAGYEKSVRDESQRPEIIHMFHLIDPLGRGNDGIDTPHVTNESFSYRDGKEIQPAWFAVTDVMPFLALETVTPYQLGKSIGQKFDQFGQQLEKVIAGFSQTEFGELNATLAAEGYPFTFPTSMDELVQIMTSSNWYGLVDSGAKSASAHDYQYIEEGQKKLINRLYRSARETVHPSERANVRSRLRKIVASNGVLYPHIKDQTLPGVADTSFKILSAEVARVADVTFDGITTTESTSYFELPKSDKGTESDDSETRFKFFDWYLKNQKLYNDAHNKASAKLSNDGENPIQTLATSKGESPFWVIVGGKKAKLYISDDIIRIGDSPHLLDEPLKNHRHLAERLSKMFPNQKVSLVPTAIGLVLQLRANGSVLLPERGSSYIKQVDLVWKNIVENGTPAAVKGLLQNEIIRVHPNAMDSLPDGQKIKLPWYLAKDFPTDSEGFVDTSDLKSHWQEVVERKTAQVAEAAKRSSTVERFDTLEANNSAATLQRAREMIVESEKRNTNIKEKRQLVMATAGKLVDKKDKSRLKEVSNYISGVSPELTEPFSTDAALVEAANTLRMLTADFNQTADQIEKSEVVLSLFTMLRYRAITGGIEAMEYFNARPSLLTAYTVFGEAGVKNIIEGSQVHVEKPEIGPGKTHFYNAGGNTFAVYEDNLGNFDQSAPQDELISTLSDKNLDSALILTTPESDQADCKMLILEKDGSYSAMCGNGTRVVGDLYYSKNPDQAGPVRIETIDGEIVEVSRSETGFVSRLSTVVPLSEATKDTAYKCLVGSAFACVSAAEVLGKHLPEGISFREVSQILGEPHLLLQVDGDYTAQQLSDLAESLLRYNEGGQLLFPAGINVNFIRPLASRRIGVATYERGVNNFTLSCGTGAVCSANLLLREDPQAVIYVQNPGGELKVSHKDGHYYLEGSVERIKD